MIRLERADQWVQIELEGRQRTLRYGDPARPHETHHVDTRLLPTIQHARDSIPKLVEKLRAEGYVTPGAGIEPPREPALEAAIRATHDPAAYAVYGDWLQERGSSLGELIATALAGTPRRELEIEYGPTDPTRYTVGWRSGLWSWLRLHDFTGAKDYDPVALAHDAFARCACCALDELRLGSVRYPDDAAFIANIIAAAGIYGWARSLRSLVVGDHDLDMQDFRVGEIGAAITTAFPGLEELRIVAGDVSFAGLHLPSLRSLHVETLVLSNEILEQLAMPHVTELVLWFGSPDLGCDIGVDELAPLLARPHTKLGICNFASTHELVHTLHVPTLETLDLSKGTLDDEAARALARRRHHFPVLRQLDVSQSYLASVTVDALRAAFQGVEVLAGDQRQPYDGERYVAVTE